MNRWTGTVVAILGCVLLAVVTFFLVDMSASKGYSTPQAVFEASCAAAKKNDFRAWGQCFTDESREFMLVQDVIFFVNEELAEAKTDDKKAAIRALAQVQAQHGLTPEFLAKHQAVWMKIQQARNVPREVLAQFARNVFAPVKDPLSFFEDMQRAKFKGDRNALAEWAEMKLSKVQISGRVAQGTVAIPAMAKGRPMPMFFKKDGDSWRIDMIGPE